jgi:hypothetical protein
MAIDSAGICCNAVLLDIEAEQAIVAMKQMAVIEIFHIPCDKGDTFEFAKLTDDVFIGKVVFPIISADMFELQPVPCKL